VRIDISRLQFSFRIAIDKYLLPLSGEKMSNVRPSVTNKYDLADDGSGLAKSIRENAALAGQPVQRKYAPGFYSNALRLADFVAIILAGLSGYILRFGTGSMITPPDHVSIYFVALVTVGSIQMARGYQARKLFSLSTQMEALIHGVAATLFLILIYGFLSGTLRDFSRLWLSVSFVIGFVLLLTNRKMMVYTLRKASQSGQITESIVIVGANDRAEKIITSIQGTPNSNIAMLGVFDDRLTRPMSELMQTNFLGTTGDMLDYIRRHRVDRVVVALPWITSDRTNALLRRLGTVPVRIDLVPNDMIWQYPNIDMERIGGVPVLTIANSRVERQMGMIKRVEDIVISSIALLLLWPVLLTAAICVKLGSKGPAIFKQKRHGFNNQVFEVYKFRSMRMQDDDGQGVKQATRHDSRITRVGAFLRRTSIDELPQLFNVLKGDMSIVGPRPHAVQHNDEYGAIISQYFARHNVKPGITGWAQVKGLRGETDTIDKMHKRVDADLYYIEHWSLLLDLKVILMTAMTVWFHDTAY
jgi:Undecaprenyl-phosphate glucose phosphotransferase